MVLRRVCKVFPPGHVLHYNELYVFNPSKFLQHCGRAVKRIMRENKNDGGRESDQGNEPVVNVRILSADRRAGQFPH